MATRVNLGRDRVGVERGWKMDRRCTSPEHGPTAIPARRWVLAAAACAMFLFGCGVPDRDVAAPGRTTATARPNVLFISIDDLRPDLGAYGAPGAVTPRLDELAARSLLFERAYCSVASCAPSRAAVLTGLRPERTRVLDLSTHYREALPDVVTLPQLFKQAGWHTAALGKVHHGPPDGPGAGDLDDPPSWSVPCWRPERWQTYYATEEARELRASLLRDALREAEARGQKLWLEPKGPVWEAPDVADDELSDGMIALEALRRLDERAAALRETGEPFFLAVGFLKPHLPFVAPERYWKLHPPESIDLPPDEGPPIGAPSWAVTDSAEVRAHAGMPRQGDFDEEVQRELIRGYRACASFADAQVGRLLDALERLELADSTIVVVWGDHGWHLGDQDMWGKHTNYEVATRVPLILHVPGGEGARTAALSELVDLYPTLAELCGLAAPADVSGKSLVPLLADPNARVKDAIFHRYPRATPAGVIDGLAVRTEAYRLVRWTAADGALRGVELYDLERDPHERTNLADDEARADVRAELMARVERSQAPAPSDTR